MKERLNSGNDPETRDEAVGEEITPRAYEALREKSTLAGRLPEIRLTADAEALNLPNPFSPPV